MYKLAVIGNPIEHSLSPIIFQQFAKQFDIKLTYDKIYAANNNEFREKLTDFFQNNGYALNITAPFKTIAYEYADIVLSRSQYSTTSNLLSILPSKRILANTLDGIGLIRDLTDKSHQLLNKKVLICGSGGVMESVIVDLITQSVQSITILARNIDRTKYLQQKYQLNIFSAQKEYDIIINTIPNTNTNIFSSINIYSDTTVFYDMYYTDMQSTFIKYIRSINSQAIIYNGIGMLVEQAAACFQQLFLHTPNTVIIKQHLKQEIASIPEVFQTYS